MPKFLTIFPNAENVHLIKDVGMIPYTLHREYGYDSTIASYKNGVYPYYETEVKGITQVFISKKFNNEILNVCWFILMNFRKYDILQCYHISEQSLIYLNLFKILKGLTFSKSFTYLKLDLNDFINDMKFSKKVLFLLKRTNLISVETKKMHNHLNENNIFGKTVELIPNGFNNNQKREILDFNFKENLIITVGRIGSSEKNNEVLLEAFKDLAKVNSEWKLELIGPIEKDFQAYIDNYYYENPNLISRVMFTGNISDRESLQEKYNKAKIFALTSPKEGFPLVFLEAIKSGCSLISPKFSSAIDVTCDEKYGSLFEIGNYKLLSQKMLELVDNPIKLEMDCVQIQNFAYDNFTWKKICGDIDKLLNFVST